MIIKNKIIMTEKILPFTREKLEEIIKSKIAETPFYIYDEKEIRENARHLLKAFSWNKGFKEFFAVKATPNPFILKILKEEGFGTDCSSLSELNLSEKVGITGEEIMFSSNDTPAKEFVSAKELGATINLDDISHISFLEKECGGIPELISVRYNPGKLRNESSIKKDPENVIMKSPETAKYGFTWDQIFEGLEMLRNKGAKRFGLHTFSASNELNPQFFIDTADMMFDLALKIKSKIGIKIEFVNISGGVGIPYRPHEEVVDLQKVSTGIKDSYDEKIIPNGLDPLAIFMECGRSITGPYGYLVSRVLHIKNIYKKHVGLDANMANLMRPAMYGAYHHITVVGKENEPKDHIYDVTGSICETID